MAEIVQSIESFIDHLGSFLSKFADNIHKMDFSCLEKVLSEASCHCSCNFESP